jgi:hypothetical protein
MTEAVSRAETTALAPSAPRGPITFQSMADQLTLGEVVTVLAALLVFVSAFLTWATVEVHTSTGARIAGAVTASMGISGGRLGTVTLGLSVAVLVTVAAMLVPFGDGWMWKVLLGFGALIALLTLLDMARIPRTMAPDNFSCPSRVTCTFHRSIGPGTWFTLAAGLVVLAGAYLHHWRPLYFRSGDVSSKDEPDQPAAAAGTSG